MRYGQSKQESAELLRMALARMTQHPAATNPQTYAVWYEYVAGINPRLSAEVDALIAAGKPLDDAAMAQLHGDHVADVDEDTARRISADFGRVMERLSETAASTSESANTFSERLGTLKGSLGGDAPMSAKLVGDALDWTTRMQHAVEGLQHQVVASRMEVQSLREDLERTREESLRCPLTRVLNRKGFDQKLEALVGAGHSHDGSGFLVMVDIDHFKKVNDDHGHLVGDRVLEGIGAVLMRVAEPFGASAARYGGEEFALLLPSASQQRAVALAEAVREAAKRMRIRQRQSDRTIATVTVSAGVASLRAGDDAAMLVARADEALYRSKTNGRDRVTVAQEVAQPA
jgi:diguanylate cyclase